MKRKKIFTRERIYWTSQIIGWGCFTLINFLFSVTIEGLKTETFIILPSYMLVGLLLTHIYRIYIKKNKWYALPIRTLIYKVIGSNFAIAVIVVSCLYLISLLLGLLEDNFNVAYIFLSLFNVFIIIIGWSLIYFAIHFFENYRNSEIERLVWEAAVKDFELKTLKSQLNPHFMFNALNSIRSLIEENPERAKTAINQLSNIFRYSLKIDRVETVPLEEELKTVVDYLGLEKVRFEERLNYKIEIDPLSKSIEIPPMMVQTLVENGIKHGISKIPEGGELEILTKSNGECLNLRIRNSGEIDLEKLTHSSGYGVSNTKQRLNLLFGERSFFKIYNENSAENRKFVVVDIKIPLGGNCNESFNS